MSAKRLLGLVGMLGIGSQRFIEFLTAMFIAALLGGALHLAKLSFIWFAHR